MPSNRGNSLQRSFLLWLTPVLFLLSGCSLQTNREFNPIRLNQLGFYPKGPKLAVIAMPADSVYLIDSASGETVWEGLLSNGEYWQYSEETVQLVDFSEWQRPGTYFLRVPGVGDSRAFRLDPDIYEELHSALLKSFYFQRASTALLPEYAGKWSRPAGHPDTDVRVDRTASASYLPAGAAYQAPGGWYDAGDYGKYMSTACTSVHLLMAAYESFPERLQSDQTGIPESGNQQADLLDEVRHQLDWILLMQDTSAGYFYHKIVSLQHAIHSMPHQDTVPRYLTGIQTGTTLTATAVMAQAARVFADLDPDFAARCLIAAQKAWRWARINPGLDTGTGESEAQNEAELEESFQDEFMWASTELYLSTGLDSFYNFNYFLTASAYPNTPTFRDTEPFSVLSVIRNQDRLTFPEDADLWQSRFLGYANRFRKHAMERNPYRVAMGANGIYDFRTSSNDINAAMGLICLEAYRLIQDASYLETATAAVDYLLGRNAVDQSFVTGFGAVAPHDIHKIIDHNDGIDEPVPGFVAGGAQGYELIDGCEPTHLPATTYHDKWGCHSTNEPTVAMQAMTFYLLTALESIQQKQAD